MIDIMDVINSLGDQRADKLALANGEENGIFAIDAQMLQAAIDYIRTSGWHDAEMELPRTPGLYYCACKYSAAGKYFIYTLEFHPEHREFAYAGVGVPPVDYWMPIPPLPHDKEITR